LEGNVLKVFVFVFEVVAADEKPEYGVELNPMQEILLWRHKLQNRRTTT
jgi:hypothetical protein